MLYKDNYKNKGDVLLITDLEIKQYLTDNNWSVNAQDCLIKVLNTSHQIIDVLYDSETNMMTIITPDNRFVFKWNLRKILENK